MASSDTTLKGPDLEKGVKLEDLREGEPLVGHAFGENVVVVRSGERAHAVGATCAHYGGPLAEGLVAGHTLRCPWHHACFDLRTGAVLGGPALNPIACYEVEREGDLIRLTGKIAPDAVTKKGRRTDAHAHPDSVVVIGGGPAGTSCVDTLRVEGYSKKVTLIADEGPVDRPNLSKDYLVGNAPEEWMPLRSADYFKEQRIDFRVGTSATAIDTTRRIITLADGVEIPYGALVLAMGAEPVRLGIEGAELPHVHVLRTLADSRAIIEASKQAKRVVVIGTSFIGLEVAASLRQRGLDVTIVGPETVPLARVMGDEVGAFVQRIHEDKGERFKLGHKPAKITDHAVVLDDGETLEADLVVMGVGVRPRLGLAQAAGLRIDGGIIVDEKMRTSNEHVYAVGDIARYPYDGALVRIEHFSVAVRQGRTAALSLLGREPQVRDVPFFWSAHHDVTLSYVGHAERFDRVVIQGKLTDRDALVGYFDGDHVRAVITVNRDAQGLLAEHAFETGDQSALKRLLSAGASESPAP
jgi:NADPH-dependent 2,4-dienoyl-CoA reductase/sulfur reductase-like enzyme/nitrite reductase/ring-hydroxylating ferredoxin subunit